MSKMKVLNVLVVIALIMSFLFNGSAPAATAVPLANEVDTTSGSQPAAPNQPTAALPVIADFESGIPAGFVGFADSWDGSGSSTTLAMITATVALPVMPAAASNTVVSVTANIASSGGWGGGPGYGGVSHDFSLYQDWSNYAGFSFWFKGSNTGQELRIELKTDGANPGASNRFVYAFTDNFTTWQSFNIPWASFAKRTDFNPGAGLGNAITLGKMWGYSVLLPGGYNGTFNLDQVELAGYSTTYDFESGIPAGFVGFADSWDGSGSSTTLAMVTATVALPVMPAAASNTVVSVTANIASSGGWGGGPGYGGVSHDFSPYQDWSNYAGFSFWFKGSNTGQELRIELKTDGANPGASNRFVYAFTDNATTWQSFTIPWANFAKRTDFNPGAGLGNSIVLSKMWGYSILLPGGYNGTFNADNFAAAGRGPYSSIIAGFPSATYNVSEGAGSAQIPVQLNATSATTVTVDYATLGGTATPNVDYTPVSNTLTFAPGATVLTVTVPITDDVVFELSETIVLSLTGASNATIGSNNPTTINIINNDTQPGSLMLFDFEAGMPSGYFADPGGNISANVVTDNALSQLGVSTNHVLSVSVTTPRAWAGLQGFNISPAQNWSTYDGVSFWFKGTNSGKTFLYVITQDGGAGLYQAPFIDNSTSWKYVSLPWETFKYREGASGTPTLSLTSVSAYFIQLSDNGGDTGFSGTFSIDQMKLFDNTIADVFDFEAGMPGGGFADPGGQIASSIVTTDTLAQFGVSNNHVLAVSVTTPRAWAGLQGFNIAPAQDWSTHNGVSFWFKGTNSGKTFLYAITQGGGAGLYQASFVDNTAGWKLVSLPWQAFSYREGATGTPTLSLTSVTAYFIQFSDNGGDTGFSGTFYVDQMKLFDTAPTNVYDYESGLPSGYFADPGGQISANVVATNTLSQLGVITNHVLAVNVVAPRAWAGLQGFNVSPAQDWSAYDGVSFWFKGTNSGKTFLYAITQGSGAGLYQASFKDNTTGWKLVNLPWQAFTYREGATGTPILSLTSVTAYFIQFSDNGGDTGFTGTFYLDQMAVYGPTGTFYIDQIASAFNPSAPAWRPSRVAFASASYAVSENAGSAVIDVVLDAASTVPVTVSYATQGGTATPNVDYTPVNGSLVFAPAVTVMTFTVPITDNVQYNIFKTVGLSLTNVISGELGAINPATLIINDNDSPNSLLIDNFENGLTSGKDIFNNQIGYSTWGSTQGNVAITVTSGMTYTGGSLPNTVLKVTSNIENWGGFTDAFPRSNTWSHQDWSRYDGLRFWFYGTNSGKQIQVEIFDNRQLENTGDSAERYYQRFPDNFSGWQQISLPFALFQRRTDFQPGGAPADGLNLTDVSGYAFNLPSVSATTIYYIDQVEVYGDLSAHPATTRVGFSAYAYGTIEGQSLVAEVMLNTPATSPITVTYAITTDTASSLDFTGPLSGTVVFAVGEQYKTIAVQTIDDSKVEPREQLKISLTNAVGAPIGYVSRALLVIVDNDVPDPKVIDDFEAGVPVGLNVSGNVTVTAKTVLATDPLAVPGQNPDNTILDVSYNLAAGTSGGFTREFDTPQDFSQSDGVSFWFNGTGSGKTITFTLLDNNVTNTVPADWTLAWSDEFSGTNGAAPNPANWGYDLGGGGWGNNEWEYYTDSRDNSALDGSGNLVISAKANTNPAYTCTSSSPTGPGGPCYATSARLLSAGKQEFAFGRVEARLQIPKGQGIWPAFWMLGNDIFTTNPWPASGEIDIMENIGKPSEQGKVYGTIHGPGYSGGSGIGGSRDITPTVLADNFHVYAIEWEPTAIRWYLDGYNYFTATKSMIPVGTKWVFDHPFFIIMNIAVGGNWPGYPDGTTVMPQMMKVDYVRVYQAPDTAERFETTFVDNTVGWRKVILPFKNFKRSATQPAGAPNDGLTLTTVHGYGFTLAAPSAAVSAPSALAGQFYLDDMRQAHLTQLYLPIIPH